MRATTYLIAAITALICIPGAALVQMSAVADTKTRTAKLPADLAAQIAELQAKVSDLEDRRKIHEVLLRYGRGIDRLDEQSYRSAFWPDAQINYGTKESITPEEHWNVHMMKWHKETLNAWGHLLTNESVEIDGDVAHVETYAVGMPMRKQEGPGILWGGRYIDRLDRRDGEWRIAVREYIPFFAMKTEINPAWLEGYNANKEGCTGHAWSWRGTRDTRYVRPLPRRSADAGPPCAH